MTSHPDKALASVLMALFLRSSAGIAIFEPFRCRVDTHKILDRFAANRATLRETRLPIVWLLPVS
ncbi:hypothetical protein G6M50_25935 [Agrobacterium rhizogenes]|nr:hypothetical protein [Rhizobium rhizogenes]NTJ81232.1 hypothetical protein [Rhizobium rhizogenes]